MNLKQVFLLCAVVFLGVIGFMIFQGGKLGYPDKKDPSTLPFPSREFEDWRKVWEKQRGS